MPYIAVNSSQVLSEDTKQRIVQQLGKDITMIPGKKEEKLMIEFADGKTMAFGGTIRDLAYVDVKCYKEVVFEDKKTFTKAVFALMKTELGLEKDAVYLSFAEFDTWGTQGTLK